MFPVTLVSQTGTYIGDWKNGLQHGKGSAVYLNGNQYGGEFKHGLKNGYGEFIVINGDRYRKFLVLYYQIDLASVFILDQL